MRWHPTTTCSLPKRKQASTVSLRQDLSQLICRVSVLSIDIGSTAARATLAWRNGDEIQTRVVRFPDRTTGGHPNDPVKYESGDSHFQFQREKVPFKFVPFVILEKIDYMQEQDPVGIQLKKEISKVGFNETNFKAALEVACKQFLRFILLSAKETLEKEMPDKVQINMVAMPVPSQWDISFQSVYQRLLKESFAEIFEQMAPVAARDINVVFHNDATAIAQYFLHASSDAQGLGLRGRGIIHNIDAVGGGINTQLFIHCGGHRAVGQLYSTQILSHSTNITTGTEQHLDNNPTGREWAEGSERDWALSRWVSKSKPPSRC